MRAALLRDLPLNGNRLEQRRCGIHIGADVAPGETIEPGLQSHDPAIADKRRAAVIDREIDQPAFGNGVGQLAGFPFILLKRYSNVM